MSDTAIKNGVLTKYTGTDTDVIIPEGVTTIGDSALAYCWNGKTQNGPTGNRDLTYNGKAKEAED